MDGLVDNPLPQMIFLWDGLERDEKLVLALLAETLDGRVDHARPAEQPGALDRDARVPARACRSARIATALEKLFQREMLLRNDTTESAGLRLPHGSVALWIRRSTRCGR